MERSLPGTKVQRNKKARYPPSNWCERNYKYVPRNESPTRANVPRNESSWSVLPGNACSTVAKVPRSECSTERKFHGSDRKVLSVDFSLLGTKRPGLRIRREPIYYVIYPPLPRTCAHRISHWCTAISTSLVVLFISVRCLAFVLSFVRSECQACFRIYRLLDRMTS